jgi:hypothetical protein
MGCGASFYLCDCVYRFHVFYELYNEVGALVEKEGMETGFRRAAAESGSHSTTCDTLGLYQNASAACAGTSERKQS